MRNLFRHASACSIVAAALAVALTAAEAAQLGSRTDPAYSALESQNQAGFGYAITFVAGSYTPPAIVSLFRRPLASQDQAGFGYAISFSGSSLKPSEIAVAH